MDFSNTPYEVSGPLTTTYSEENSNLNQQVQPVNSASMEKINEEARWPKQQEPMITFKILEFEYNPYLDLEHQEFCELKLRFGLLKNTIIEQCMEDCECTPEDFCIVDVPASITLPSIEKINRCLLEWQKKNPEPIEFLKKEFDENLANFLDFLGVNFKIKENPHTGFWDDIVDLYEIEIIRMSDGSELEVLKKNDRGEGLSTYLHNKEYSGIRYQPYCSYDFDDDEPRRNTKRRIQQKRQRQYTSNPDVEDDEIDQEEYEAAYAEFLAMEENFANL
jgi:hypothetical protein